MLSADLGIQVVQVPTETPLSVLSSTIKHCLSARHTSRLTPLRVTLTLLRLPLLVLLVLLLEVLLSMQNCSRYTALVGGCISFSARSWICSHASSSFFQTKRKFEFMPDNTGPEEEEDGCCDLRHSSCLRRSGRCIRMRQRSSCPRSLLSLAGGILVQSLKAVDVLWARVSRYSVRATAVSTANHNNLLQP